MIMKCILKSLENKHVNIALLDKTAVVLGRSAITEIIDKRCSKKQVEVTADYALQNVSVKQLGANASFIGNQRVGLGEVRILFTSETLYFLEGLHPFGVEFEGNHHQHNSSSSSPTPGLKRKSLSENKESATKRQKNETNPKKICVENGSSSEDENIEQVKQRLKQMQHAYSSITPQTENEKFGQKETPETSVQPTTESVWENVNAMLLTYTKAGVEGRCKTACFDMDGTIITTKSGKVFPVDIHDWRFLFPEVPGKLRKLFADGYKIVFFTNQMGVSKGKLKEQDLKAKVTEITRQIPAPIQVFVSTGPGLYRKPCLGMWNYLNQNRNQGVVIDKSSSFYCGDGAGRPADWMPKKKKDFSCSDRLFAMNAKITFHTPEEFFQGTKKASYNLPIFDPTKLDTKTELTNMPKETLTSTDPEVIVNVGFPASGKSFFSKTHLTPRGYIHISRDDLGSWQACVNKCMKALDAGRRVVIDNTNPDPESRKRYIECAKKKNVPCRCFYFDLSFEHVKHNERFREITDSTHVKINEMLLNSFKKKFVEPSAIEGFTEIRKINFVPKFTDRNLELLYHQYLLEK